MYLWLLHEQVNGYKKKKSSGYLPSPFNLPVVKEVTASVPIEQDYLDRPLIFIYRRIGDLFYTTGVTQSLGDGTFAGGVLLYTVPVGFEFYLQRVQMGAQDNNPVPDVSWVNFGSIQGEPVFSTKPDAILHSVDFTIPFPVFTAGSELKIWTERSGTTKVVGNCQMLGFLVSIKTP